LFYVELLLLQVTSVRLPSDGGRAKGFGYAEFEDRQSLLDALAFSEAVSLNDFFASAKCLAIWCQWCSLKILHTHQH